MKTQDEMATFEKVNKKFALSNSYFKNIKCSPNAPQTPEECYEYFLEYGELPFRDSQYMENGELNDWWLYDCFVEYQKRAGVALSQFFTPKYTAEKIAYLADKYFTESADVLDACCGFGSLSRVLREKYGFCVMGFDIDPMMVNLYGIWGEGYYGIVKSFEEFSYADLGEKKPFTAIVANPPYELPVLTDFLEKMHDQLANNGKMILLLPYGFIRKERPKKIVEALKKYRVLHCEQMPEEFARTKAVAEIVVLEKENDDLYR